MSERRNKNCSVCLPVEIGVSVNVRTVGPIRPRGGNEQDLQVREYSPERLQGGESTQPISALQDILRKQRNILEGLTSAQSPHDRKKSHDHQSKARIKGEIDEPDAHQPQERIAAYAESSMVAIESSKKSRHEEYRKKSGKREVVLKSSFEKYSNETPEDENIENDEMNTRKRRLKGGNDEYDKIEGESNMYQFQIKGNHMVELFNRKKVRMSKLETSKSNTNGISLNKNKNAINVNDKESSDDDSS